MAKISIYVPDEMQARMNQHPEINWSKLFQNNVVTPCLQRLERDWLFVSKPHSFGHFQKESHK